jgi:hypothetical protein
MYQYRFCGLFTHLEKKSTEISWPGTINVNMLHFFVVQSQLGLPAAFLKSPILYPIIDFESVFEFGIRLGYIIVKPSTIEFPDHGIVVQRDDAEPSKQTRPQQEQQPVQKQRDKQQGKPHQPQPGKQPDKQPSKTIPIHPNKLHYVATKLISGFERQLVGKTLEMIRPVLLYTMDTRLTFDRPIKEFQFAGYQIFRYFI